MRIDVIGTEDSTTPQARAYAEYRLFATLARHARVIRSVRVVLAHAERNGSTGRMTCAVDLMLEPSGSARDGRIAFVCLRVVATPRACGLILDVPCGIRFTCVVFISFCARNGPAECVEKDSVLDGGRRPVVPQRFSLNAGPFILNDGAVGRVAEPS
jgi:hypothetical protein